MSFKEELKKEYLGGLQSFIDENFEKKVKECWAEFLDSQKGSFRDFLGENSFIEIDKRLGLILISAEVEMINPILITSTDDFVIYLKNFINHYAETIWNKEFWEGCTALNKEYNLGVVYCNGEDIQLKMKTSKNTISFNEECPSEIKKFNFSPQEILEHIKEIFFVEDILYSIEDKKIRGSYIASVKKEGIEKCLRILIKEKIKSSGLSKKILMYE